MVGRVVFGVALLKVSRLPSLGLSSYCGVPFEAQVLEICVVTRLLSAGEGSHSEPDGLLKATGD